MPRRVRGVVALAVTIVTAAALALIVHTRRGHGPRLVGRGEAFNFCWQPTQPGNWARMSGAGMEFGLDFLTLSPARGRVTVTAARLIRPSGGLRLITAVFAPGGGFGSGAFGHQYGLPSYLTAHVQSVPAELSVVTPAGAPADFHSSRWQVAIVVSAPVSATDASAAGVKLTYRSGSATYTYRTADHVRLVQHAQCP